MEILSYIIKFIYAAFIVACIVGTSIMLYDYLQERKARKAGAKQETFEDEDVLIELTNKDTAVEFELKRDTSNIISDLSYIVCGINEVSTGIKELDNPDLHFALENLNSAATEVLSAAQVILDLNYPIDEEELNK